MDERFTGIETIVFDIGNVLLRFEPEKVCRMFPEGKQEAFYKALFEPRCGMSLWDRMDLGIPENDVIAMEAAAAAGYPGEEKEVLRVMEYFPQTMYPLPLYDQLPELKEKGKHLYALTNYPEPAFTNTLERFENLKLMEGIVVSSREKVKKPDERIFHLITERYALSPEKTLFIDDREDNIAAAQQAGFQTWHYLDGLKE